MLLAVAIVFFICLSASYGSNICDNTADKNFYATNEFSKDLDPSLNKEIKNNKNVEFQDLKSGSSAYGEKERPSKLSQESIINTSKKVEN